MENKNKNPENKNRPQEGNYKLESSEMSGEDELGYIQEV